MLLNSVFCVDEYLASTKFFFGGGGGGLEKHCQWNYFNTCTVHRLLFCTMTNNCMYVPDRHDSSVNIKTVYTATTKTDFMRIVATK